MAKEVRVRAWSGPKIFGWGATGMLAERQLAQPVEISCMLPNGRRVVKIDELIAAVQVKLGVSVDGVAGPQTWEAIYGRIVKPIAKTGLPPSVVDKVDARSETIIATLQPEVHPYARALVQKCEQHGISIRIISGLRSYAEQDALYAQGRTKPGDIITNAHGGYSNHNFGIAFDVGVYEGTRYRADSPKYAAVGVLGMELGLSWGGTWKSLVDQPHFQLRPDWARDLTEGQMLAELRRRVAAGTPVFG